MPSRMIRYENFQRTFWNSCSTRYDSQTFYEQHMAFSRETTIRLSLAVMFDE